MHLFIMSKCYPCGCFLLTGITCPDLDDPSYGKVNVTGNIPGYKAHYKCDYGYRLVGEAYRRCLDTGYWSGEEPVCQRKKLLGRY